MNKSQLTLFFFALGLVTSYACLANQTFVDYPEYPTLNLPPVKHSLSPVLYFFVVTLFTFFEYCVWKCLGGSFITYCIYKYGTRTLH